MWIHPKDKVVLENKTFEVKSVEGLYSSGPVSVILIDLKTKKTKSYPLLHFNQLHEQGKIKVTQNTKRNFHGY